MLFHCQGKVNEQHSHVSASPSYPNGMSTSFVVSFAPGTRHKHFLGLPSVVDGNGQTSMFATRSAIASTAKDPTARFDDFDWIIAFLDSGAKYAEIGTS